MNENELSAKILDGCFEIHRKLGPGLFESVYEELLCFELEKAGLTYLRQKSIPVYYKDIVIQVGFKADLIIEEKVILEIKSVERLAPVHSKQLLTYLKLTNLKLGLLLNFNEAFLKNGIVRLANNL
jgi:GxxExxY protein